MTPVRLANLWRTLALLVLVCVTGCKVGPNFKRPRVGVPGAWVGSGPAAGHVARPPGAGGAGRGVVGAVPERGRIGLLPPQRGRRAGGLRRRRHGRQWNGWRI